MVDYEINSVPMSMPLWRRKVERFLERNELRLDGVDYYAVITEPDGDEILAGGGLQGDIIKCIAVSERHRDAHLTNRLVSHLISEAAQRGWHSVKVFTKPANRTVFESLGFHLLGEAPLAILMENGRGLEAYLARLRQAKTIGAIAAIETIETIAPKATGIIVMNANPFTLGHRYLIEQAAKAVDRLFVIPVKADGGHQLSPSPTFPYAERKAMIEAGTDDLGNVVVLDGSDYQISQATFPTYFLKQLSDAAETQMRLDIDLFRHHIAPALDATVRFVGSEPHDALTLRYNELLQQQLMSVKVIERKQQDGTAISASNVRKALQDGCFADAATLVPPTTIPYLLAHLACDALRQELDATPKPGLVDRHDSGAHADMDYRLMLRSIEALRPYFVRLAKAGQQGRTDHPTLSAIGIEAERAMLQATGGVNTHRGALFALGLAVAAQGKLAATPQRLDNLAATPQRQGKLTTTSPNGQAEALQQVIVRLAQQFPDTKGTHGSQAVATHHAKGALAMAREGYRQLFSDWLPFYQREKAIEAIETIESIEAIESIEPIETTKIRTLLRIMSQLDDTNVLYRCGADVARQVKEEARAMLADFHIEQLEAMNRRYIAENISPGGSADMLALTIFICNITRN